MKDLLGGILIDIGKLLAGMIAFRYIVWVSGYKIVKKQENKQ